MRRSKHSLSHYVLSTFDMGQLIPVGCYEVLPGDSIRMATSMLMRVTPMLAPPMHPVQVRLHHWFVPTRILWDGWEDFITAGPDGDDASTPPVISVGTVESGSLLNYLGVPLATDSELTVSALPLRAYNLIFNEFYRDQDLIDPVDDEQREVLRVAWEKDYFTAARPWPQKGPEITLPIGTTAPVIPASTDPPEFLFTDTSPTDGPIRGAQQTSGTSNLVHQPGTNVDGAPLRWSDPNLLADLTSATAASVNDLRLAMALQRYAEARAQYGSRYSEYLRYLGVRSSDARLQRPEYLGGGRATISFSEVLRTGNAGEDPQNEAVMANMYGHGISAMRSRRWIRFFEEHGFVMTLCSVRPRSLYMQGLHRMWSRQTREDFWQKELEQIGQQEVQLGEVYMNAAAPADTFGFQDRYSEYRHLPSRINGEFATSSLNMWHFGREFESEPVLNQSFVDCDPPRNPFAITAMNALWCMFSHSIQARRLVGNRTIGRIF